MHGCTTTSRRRRHPQTNGCFLSSGLPGSPSLVPFPPKHFLCTLASTELPMSDAEDDEHDAQLAGADEPSDRENRENSAFRTFFADLIKRAGAEADKSLRLFEQKGGEYFTAHGADAERIADEFFSTREILKNVATLATVNIRPQKLETILKHALLQNGQSVELYARDANSSSGAWLLSKKASPGNLQSFEDLLFHRSEMVENALVMAVRLATGADSKVPLMAPGCNRLLAAYFFLSQALTRLAPSLSLFGSSVFCFCCCCRPRTISHLSLSWSALHSPTRPRTCSACASSPTASASPRSSRWSCSAARASVCCAPTPAGRRPTCKSCATFSRPTACRLSSGREVCA